MDGQRQVVDSGLAHSIWSGDKVGEESALRTQRGRSYEEFRGREVGLVFPRFDEQWIGGLVHEQRAEGVDFELLPEGIRVDGLNSLRTAGDTCWSAR